jgi:hypothetical protein
VNVEALDLLADTVVREAFRVSRQLADRGAFTLPLAKIDRDTITRSFAGHLAGELYSYALHQRSFEDVDDALLSAAALTNAHSGLSRDAAPRRRGNKPPQRSSTPPDETRVLTTNRIFLAYRNIQPISLDLPPMVTRSRKRAVKGTFSAPLR